MNSGKKSVAERIVYGAFEQIEKKSGKTRRRGVYSAMSNVRPDGRGQEPSGRWCQLSGAGRSASEPSYRAGHALAEGAARKRGEKSMGQRLAGELLDAAEGRGSP
jgi:small subunit ribosomal protein S7